MAYKKVLRKLGTDDEAFSRFQDNVSQAIEPFLRFPLSDGVLLQGVDLDASGFKTIAHRLGRPVRGWFVVRKFANADVWEDPNQASQKDKFLLLRASATVRVDLWVF